MSFHKQYILKNLCAKTKRKNKSMKTEEDGEFWAENEKQKRFSHEGKSTGLRFIH